MGRGLGSIELVYSCPPAVKQAGLATINLELPYSSAVSVWESTEQSGNRRKGTVSCMDRVGHSLVPKPLGQNKQMRLGGAQLVSDLTTVSCTVYQCPALFIILFIPAITFITIYTSSLR